MAAILEQQTAKYESGSNIWKIILKKGVCCVAIKTAGIWLICEIQFGVGEK